MDVSVHDTNLGKSQHNVKILREKVRKEADDVELISHDVQWKHSSKVMKRRQEKKEKRQEKNKMLWFFRDNVRYPDSERLLIHSVPP
jgi:hypothetical protein